MVTSAPHPPSSAVATPTQPRPRVLLIGNYLPDAQESMQRFAQLMFDELRRAGRDVALLVPPIVFGRWGPSTTRGLGKWLGYIDKYLVFPYRLRRSLRQEAIRGPFLLHICDHSNAVYAPSENTIPTIVTCHDLHAIRGALGEKTDCPASFMGKQLQRWILHGLARANVIASVSRATARDVNAVVASKSSGQRRCLVHMGLNHSYARLEPAMATARLAGIQLRGRPYILHVGSNLRRKNRDGVLRIFAKTAEHWNGMLVFAGEPLAHELSALAESLGIRERVVVVPKPSSAVLEALYNCATALLFPSRFEGFGWPIIEAQASGCPVICSDAAPLPEVVGQGGIICPLDKEDAFASAVLRLLDPHERDRFARQGFANVARFSTEQMVDGYLAVYNELGVVR